LTITRNGNVIAVPNSVVISRVDAKTFRFAGLASTLGVDGEYILTVQPISIQDAAGNPSKSIVSATWIRNTVVAPLASVSGSLFEDANGNKLRDTNEPALPGWTVYIDANRNEKFDAGERVTLTDFNGNYVFDGLVPGVYSIGQVLPKFWRQTFPSIFSQLLATSDTQTTFQDIESFNYEPSQQAYRWSDADLTTPNVIDILYDSRPLYGYENTITETQSFLVEQALRAWMNASGGLVNFIRSTTAPLSNIINIGVGDLAAIGSVSKTKATLGVGGANYIQSGESTSLTNGFVWLDQAESWDTIVGNGNVSGKYDFLTVVTREIGHAMGLQDTSVSPTGVQATLPKSTAEVISFQMHCGCGGTPLNALKYASEENQIPDQVSSTLKQIYGGAASNPGNNSSSNTSHGGFYTGQGTGYRWQDQIPSTPDTIDIYYDFRAQNGYINAISPEQISVTEQAMRLWELGSNNRIQFIRSLTAPLRNIINIGVGDLAALGSTSASRGTLALGGGTFTTLGGQRVILEGIAWMDSAERWEMLVGNGEIPGTFDFFTVVAHEIGHAVGLGHTDGLPGSNMMNGRYAGEKSSLSSNEVALITQLYSGAAPPPINPGEFDDGNYLANGSGGFHVVSVGMGGNTIGLDFGSRYSLQNPSLPLDVNDDNSIDPRDVLAIINWINTRGSSTVVNSSLESIYHYDVDGDDFIGPVDVLAVINYLNAKTGQLVAEGEAHASPILTVRDVSTGWISKNWKWAQPPVEHLNGRANTHVNEDRITRPVPDAYSSPFTRIDKYFSEIGFYTQENTSHDWTSIEREQRNQVNDSQDELSLLVDLLSRK
jgi:hypothetical protein